MQTKHSVQVLHQPVSESFKPATPKYTTNTSKDNNANNKLSPNIRCNQPTAASTPNNWMWSNYSMYIHILDVIQLLDI